MPSALVFCRLLELMHSSCWLVRTLFCPRLPRLLKSYRHLQVSSTPFHMDAGGISFGPPRWAFQQTCWPGLCVPSNGEARRCRASELSPVGPLSPLWYAQQPLLALDPQSPPKRIKAGTLLPLMSPFPYLAHIPHSVKSGKRSRAVSKRELFPPVASHIPRQEMGCCP